MPERAPALLGAARTEGTAGDGAGNPAWLAALPLWAAPSWQWVRVMPDGRLRFGAKPEDGGTPSAPAEERTDADLGRPGSLLVLHCRAAPALPPACWALLARSLVPGGLLFVCGPRRRRLAAEIRAAAPGLCPAAWHVIVPRQDDTWYLRPTAGSFRQLLDQHLDPAQSAGAWLAQKLHILRLPPDAVPCLPVWKSLETHRGSG